MKRFLTTMALVLFLVPAAAHAADGDLDTGFNASGTVPGTGVYSLGTGAKANDLVIMSDGSILAVGEADGTLAFLKVDTGGQPDSGFGTSGKAVLSPPAGSTTMEGKALAVQSSGRIVAGCTRYVSGSTSWDLALTRITSNGSLDTSFGDSSGWTLHDFGGTMTQVSDILVLGDDSIIVAGITNAGTSGTIDMFLARYTADGVLDTSFGDAGGYTIEDYYGAADGALSVSVTSQGRYLVGGSLGYNTTNAGVARFLANGSLDTSFGTWNGFTDTEHATGSDWTEARGLGLLADGSMFLAGTHYHDSGSWYSGLVAKLDADGYPVQGFGTNGIATYNPDPGADSVEFHDCLAQADGKVVVAGYHDNGTDKRLIIMRFDAAGNPDQSFGSSGRTRTLTKYAKAEGKALARDADYNFVTAGLDDADFVLARYLGSQTFAPSTSSSGGCISGQSLSAAMLVLLAVGLAVVKLVVRFSKTGTRAAGRCGRIDRAGPGPGPGARAPAARDGESP